MRHVMSQKGVRLSDPEVGAGAAGWDAASEAAGMWKGDVMQKVISSNQFLAAFQSVIARSGSDFQAAYANQRSRTERMLQAGGIMSGVCDELAKSQSIDLEYKQEWYTIDALFVSGKELLYPDSPKDKNGSRLWYPSRLDVLIEHENGERLEEEMWKLLFWRAGLKVLIGYDYSEDEHDEPLGKRHPGKTKGDWAPDKLEFLRTMHREAGGGDDDSEYLLLIGNRESWSSANPVSWRFSRIDVPGQALQILPQP